MLAEEKKNSLCFGEDMCVFSSLMIAEPEAKCHPSL